MSAGGSAQQRASDLNDKAAQLRAAADRAERDAEQWDKGRVGEERVAQVLDSLAAHRVRAVHDRSAPDSDANLDHLVVAPSGVYVIDAKNWSGTLAIADQHLTQNGRRRDNVILGAIAQLEVVRRFIDSLGPPHPIPIHIVICFAGTARIGRPTRLSGVDLVDLNHLPWTITQGPPQLSPVDVEFLARQFLTRLAPRTGFTEVESRALPMEPPPEPVVFMTRWKRHGHDRIYVMDENGDRGGFLDLASGDVLAESDTAEPVLRRLLAVHLSTTTRDETTDEARGIISRFLRRRTAADAQRIDPPLVVGRQWQNYGKRRLYVHWLGPHGDTTDLGWFDLDDRRVQQAAPDVAPIVRYCGEQYLACRAEPSD